MTDVAKIPEVLRFDATVGEDGTLILHLPPDVRGRVQVQVEIKRPRQIPEWREDMTPEEEEAFFKAIFDIMQAGGLGLPIGEILKSPAVGMWADRPETQDSVAWVEEQRRKSRERRLSRE